MSPSAIAPGDLVYVYRCTHPCADHWLGVHFVVIQIMGPSWCPICAKHIEEGPSLAAPADTFGPDLFNDGERWCPAVPRAWCRKIPPMEKLASEQDRRDLAVPRRHRTPEHAE